MTVRYTTRAEAELEAIGDWIAADNPTRAVSFVQQLCTACDEIAEHPRPYPLLAGSIGIRHRLVRRYIIFHRVTRDRVVIVSVRHGARDNSHMR